MRPSLDQLHAACPGVESRLLRAHLERLPDHYFARFETEEIYRHVRALAGLDPESPVDVLFHDEADDGIEACTVLAFDAPGVFSLITGILAASGYSIEAGDIFTYARAAAPEPPPGRRPRARTRRRPPEDPWQRRRIIDFFSGRLAPGCPVAEWREELRARLREVLGVLETGYRDAATTAKHWVIEQVTEHLAVTQTSHVPLLFPVEIDIRNGLGPFTRVIVNAQDTPAFLYSLSLSLSLHDLSIEHVRIRTVDGHVVDELDLVDAQGEPILDESVLDKIRLSVVLTKQFSYFLDTAPDPYIALARFEHLAEEIVRLPEGREWRASLSDPHLMRDLARILGASDYLWEDFVRTQYESLLPMLAGDRSRAWLREGDEPVEDRLRGALSAEGDPEERRARFNEVKNQEVFLADLEHLLVPEVSFRDLAARLTRLAEAVVNLAVETLYREMAAKHGEPQTVAGLPAAYAVLGLGKLGGAALGYASDIEMLLVFSDQGETSGPEVLDNGEFFNRLVLQLGTYITAKREGIFQLDLRLRPHGQSGPPACSLASFVSYYGPGGPAHSYERLALVRLRAIGGDPDLGRRVERLRDENVYSSPSIVLAELQDLRAKQFREKNVPGRYNAKFGPGALVDLEYAVQILQVMHGKTVPALRTPRIHAALEALADAGVLERDECGRLTESYQFLRQLINGLRMLRGSAKDLFLPPVGDEEFAHLARRMGYERKDDLDPATQLRVTFESRTAAVRAFVENHFGRALLPGPATRNVADLVLSGSVPDDLRDPVLTEAGFENTARAYSNLRSLAGEGEQRSAFAKLAVLACDVLRREPEPDMALNNWDRFARTLPDPQAHIERLLSQPRRLEILLGIFSRSQFLASTLMRNIDFWDWVTSPANLQRPRTREYLLEELRAVERDHPEHPEWLDALRRFRKREMLRIGTRDMVLGDPLPAVTGALSDLAEAVVEVALERAWTDLRDAGAWDPAREDPCPHFCVLAFGKLGGRELNYSSDIDLLGVYEEGIDAALCSKVLTRMGKDLSHHTVEGIAYRVDLRLRPWGGAGTVVSSAAAIAAYYTTEASLWEIQALLKLRPVAGNLAVGRQLAERLRALLLTPRDPAAVAASIRHLRERALAERNPRGANGIDVKNGEGGLRDIEFVVQGLQLISAPPDHPEVLSGNTLDAIERLGRAGALDEEDLHRRTEDYTFLRRIEHHLQILEDRQTHSLPEEEAEVRALGRRILGRNTAPAAFLSRVTACMERVRTGYERFLRRYDPA